MQEWMSLFNTIGKDLEYVLKNIAKKPNAEPLMNALILPYEGVDESSRQNQTW